MNNLTNKIVFITGASSGIGKACAEAFAGQKANLILTARRIEKLNELAQKLSAETGVKVKCMELDVRDKDKVNEVISSLDDDWKNIAILINNAGLARGFGKIYEGETEDWEEMIDTNIKGLLYVTRQLLPLMVARKKGHIINIGSLAGHEVYPNGNVYAATKFAVNALSKSIRLDVIDKGIRVSSVDPGLVETEFSIVRFSGDEERAKNVYSGMKPLTAEDIAEAVLFCANRPDHVNINEVILTPVAQASATLVHRKNN
ncbi:MAG: NAD(P)-dependent oxidoreductase [Candidatus Cloacimonadota bacterium]|nr:MAG: NAD(P)-dependent oxidoreductase [Candidatus Cloacimonadota bacterium]